MKPTNRPIGRRIGAATALAAVTACGGMAFAPAAFAGSPVTSSTAYSTSHSATQSAAVRPATVNQCYQMLNAYGYTVTVPRGVACATASLGFPTHAIAISACIAAMKVTGVGVLVATIACTIAPVPG